MSNVKKRYVAVAIIALFIIAVPIPTLLDTLGIISTRERIEPLNSQTSIDAIRVDGGLYYSADGVNWTLNGNPEIGYRYTAVASGKEGYVFVLRNDGTVYFTDRGTNGWAQYGYGSPALPASSAYTDVGSNSTALFALRGDGRVYKSTDNGLNWSQFGDAGGDYSWVSICISDNYVYALRNDGTVRRSPTSVPSWIPWGGAVSDYPPHPSSNPIFLSGNRLIPTSATAYRNSSVSPNFLCYIFPK